jgi:DNA-binding MarR family transcriptional regulator/GNAT superfamily N-acetyltransferase
VGSEGCEVRTLRTRLGLDSGQLSRLLRTLEAERLIELIPSPADARIRFAHLTRAGLAERRLLDARSDELAASILDPLGDEEREQLTSSMRTVEHLLTRSLIDIRMADPAGPDARRCLRAYFGELNRRSDTPFDPVKGTSAEPHELRPPAGAFLIAYLGEEPVGCGAVKHRAGEPSDIKRMWVAESVRGLGLGRRLLGELEQAARDAHAPAVRLDTNRSLVEAIQMYRSNGYAETAAFNHEPFAHHWFSKTLR